MIHVTLRTGIHIENYSKVRRELPALSKWIRSQVVIPNPEYVAAVKAGRRGWGIDRDLKLFDWNRDTDAVVLPIGMFKALREKAHIAVSDARVQRPLSKKIESRIQLRDYQEPAVDALEDELFRTGTALLEAPPGSGKTEMALEVVARYSQKTLWITHTNELAEQVRQRIIDRLDVQPASIGFIGGGQAVEGQITIGLVQTLSRMDLRYWADRFGMIVLDECHHSPATTWNQVVSSFAARYRLAVSGSLQRQDGLESVTHLQFGPTTYTIERSAGGGVMVPQLRTIRTTTVPEAWKNFEEVQAEYEKATQEFLAGKRTKKPRKPHMPFPSILKDLLDDAERNRLIVDEIVKSAPGRHTLVLSNRVEHCERLAEEIALRFPVLRREIAVIHGGQSKEERSDILDRARNGKIRILFSVNIAKEGLDVPVLDQLFLVAGGKDPIFLKQAVGRIQRMYPGKPTPIVYDVVDSKVGVFQAQYWQRMRVYRELGMVQRAAG